MCIKTMMMTMTTMSEGLHSTPVNVAEVYPELLTVDEWSILVTRYYNLLTPAEWSILRIDEKTIRKFHLRIITQRIGKHVSNMNLSNSEHQRMLLKR